MIDLSSDDAKLVVLARGVMVRCGGASGAAVRDGQGRTFCATPVELDTLRLSALQAAVAAAVGNGATAFEAAAVVEGTRQDAGLASIKELSQVARVYFSDRDGRIADVFRVGEVLS